MPFWQPRARAEEGTGLLSAAQPVLTLASCPLMGRDGGQKGQKRNIPSQREGDPSGRKPMLGLGSSCRMRLEDWTFPPISRSEDTLALGRGVCVGGRGELSLFGVLVEGREGNIDSVGG